MRSRSDACPPCTLTKIIDRDTTNGQDQPQLADNPAENIDNTTNTTTLSRPT
jgi:hypothetical protein